jgi:hypothetical protein
MPGLFFRHISPKNVPGLLKDMKKQAYLVPVDSISFPSLAQQSCQKHLSKAHIFGKKTQKSTAFTLGF